MPWLRRKFGEWPLKTARYLVLTLERRLRGFAPEHQNDVAFDVMGGQILAITLRQSRRHEQKGTSTFGRYAIKLASMKSDCVPHLNSSPMAPHHPSSGIPYCTDWWKCKTARWQEVERFLMARHTLLLVGSKADIIHVVIRYGGITATPTSGCSVCCRILGQGTGWEERRMMSPKY